MRPVVLPARAATSTATSAARPSSPTRPSASGNVRATALQNALIAARQSPNGGKDHGAALPAHDHRRPGRGRASATSPGSGATRSAPARPRRSCRSCRPSSPAARRRASASCSQDDVAAKTGTAQTGLTGINLKTDDWMIAFAPANGPGRRRRGRRAVPAALRLGRHGRRADREVRDRGRARDRRRSSRPRGHVTTTCPGQWAATGAQASSAGVGSAADGTGGRTAHVLGPLRGDPPDRARRHGRRSTGPSTPGSGATSRSRCSSPSCRSTAPSSSGSDARPRPPPTSRTPTSSPSTTGARTRAPTSSSWSSSTGTLARDRAARGKDDARDPRRDDRRPGRRGPRLRAPPRRGAPRHQAGQRAASPTTGR